MPILVENGGGLRELADREMSELGTERGIHELGSGRPGTLSEKEYRELMATRGCQELGLASPTAGSGKPDEAAAARGVHELGTTSPKMK